MKRTSLALVVALLLAATSTLALADDRVDHMPTLSPLKGTPAPSKPEHPKHFVFIIAGDNRPETDTPDVTPVTKEIFKDIKKLAPAFVLWTGDTIYGKNPDDAGKINRQYTNFLTEAAKSGAPIFNAPGNHEMADSNNCPNETMKKLYLTDNGQGETYGSFDYGDSHFIALDSDQVDDQTSCSCGSQPKGEKPPGYISAKQMRRLKQDLDDNEKKDHIFIFLHRPLVGYKGEDQLCPANVTEMQDLFKHHQNVSYIVAGHQHMYYNPQGPKEFGDPPVRADPEKTPYYLVSGGAGAPLKKKGFYHYLIFKVDNDKVSVQMIPVEEKDAD